MTIAPQTAFSGPVVNGRRMPMGDGPVALPIAIAPAATVSAELYWVSGAVYDNSVCVEVASVTAHAGSGVLRAPARRAHLRTGCRPPQRDADAARALSARAGQRDLIPERAGVVHVARIGLRAVACGRIRVAGARECRPKRDHLIGEFFLRRGERMRRSPVTGKSGDKYSSSEV